MVFSFILLLGGPGFSGSAMTTTSPMIGSGAEELDTIDTPRLRPLMIGLKRNMVRVNTGICYEDYDLIREGAFSTAHGPKIAPA